MTGFRSEHNARFAVAPEHPETAFVADAAGAHRDLLCVQEERVVGNDNTVRYRGPSLQIPPSPIRPHFVKVRVRVHDYPDDMLAIFHGPRCLARYRADGSLLDHVQKAAKKLVRRHSKNLSGDPGRKAALSLDRIAASLVFGN